MIASRSQDPSRPRPVATRASTPETRGALGDLRARARPLRIGLAVAVGLSALALAGCAGGGGAGTQRATQTTDTPSTPPPRETKPILGEEGVEPVQRESRPEARPAEPAPDRPENGETTAGPGSEPAEDDGESAGNESASDEQEEDAKEKGPGRIVLRTVYDDQRVGDDQAQMVAVDLGLVEDEALERYVRSVAIRLLRHAPPRPFDWEFKIVDQSVPNAFALPGGKIYVSRGLLALVGSEDELAGVLGHEITHSAERHAAGRIDHASRLNPFTIGLIRAATIAAYGRDQERDADRGGQILAAKAGYDPGGIAAFLRKLDASDRYEIGWSRLPYFLATHPTSPERSAIAADRAASLAWTPARQVADDEPLGFFSVVDGLILGENPAGGLFEETLFVHPELRFSIRFPRGWSTMNSQRAVSALSPSRDAQATLTVEGEAGDLENVVDEFLDKEVDGIKVKIRDRRPIQVGDLPGIRIEGRASSGMVGLWTQMTFLEHDGLVYRLSMVSLASSANVYRGRARAFAHSFRPLDEAGAYSLEVTRLRLARALENETLQQLSLRTGNALELVYTGVLNDLFASTTLAAGTIVKIGLPEPYIPAPSEEESPPSEEATSESRSGPGVPRIRTD